MNVELIWNSHKHNFFLSLSSLALELESRGLSVRFGFGSGALARSAAERMVAGKCNPGGYKAGRLVGVAVVGEAGAL